jgi:hypothetical protein
VVVVIEAERDRTGGLMVVDEERPGRPRRGLAGGEPVVASVEDGGRLDLRGDGARSTVVARRP